MLDSMEHAFNRSSGTLAEKIMAAMLAAKIPGADTRCLTEGISSMSAYIRVAKPSDKEGDYFLQINVNNHPAGKDPIDILQQKYQLWKEETRHE